MINFSVAINLKCGFTKEVVKSIQEAVRSWQWSRNLHKELEFYPFLYQSIFSLTMFGTLIGWFNRFSVQMLQLLNLIYRRGNFVNLH